MMAADEEQEVDQADDGELDVSMETHPPTAKKIGRPKRKAGLEALRINKSVFDRGDNQHEEDESSDDEYPADRALENGDEGTSSDDESDDSDADLGSANAESEEEMSDDETESEDETGEQDGSKLNPVKKSRKS
jgi:hypothetical protein